MFNETCVTLQAGENCNRLIGYLAVYRIGFTMTVFHAILMFLTLCVADGNGCRAGLHNGSVTVLFINVTVMVNYYLLSLPTVLTRCGSQ